MGYYYADYWRHPKPAEPFRRGVLSSRLVSRLSGATIRQLGYWHSTGHLAATASGRRGVGRRYSWIEYSRARAAVKLRSVGLSRARVHPNIDWLDMHLPRWYEVPLVTRAPELCTRFTLTVLATSIVYARDQFPRRQE